MRKKFFLVQNLDGLLPTGWARHRAHRRGRWGAGLGAGALGAGLGAGRWARGRAWARALQAVGRAGARRSGRARVCADGRGRARTGAGMREHERACADGRGRAQGVHAQAGKRADVRALGARGAGSERQDAR